MIGRRGPIVQLSPLLQEDRLLGVKASFFPEGYIVETIGLEKKIVFSGHASPSSAPLSPLQP